MRILAEHLSRAGGCGAAASSLPLHLHSTITRACCHLWCLDAPDEGERRPALNEPGARSRHAGLHQVGDIVLEEQQVELLRTLVEAHRRVEPREEFLVMRAISAAPGGPISHHGLPEGLMVMEADLRALARVGLIDFPHRSHGVSTFSVTARGIQYYIALQEQGPPTERVEQAMRRHIDADAFKARHPAAYAKWEKAEELLWAADAQSQLTAIGHHCREAVQDFASVLVAQYKPPNCPADPTSTVARVRAVLNVRRTSLPSTVHPFLDALLTYCGTVLDLHQRQEHGAQREGRPLTWEDGRRVVFQTLLVMYELDRALSAEPR